MKKVFSIVAILCCFATANAQLEWVASYNDSPTSTNVTHAFGMCETSSGVKQINIYSDSQNKWYVDVMHITEGNDFAIDKTSELVINASEWAIQSDYIVIGIYNVCYNLIVKDKIVFEIVFEDPDPEPNCTKYWCYLFDEDGTILNYSFGKQGQIIGNYMIHESCQPYDNTQRIWAICTLGTNNTSSFKAIDFPNVNIYPNPATHQLNISQSNEEIKIYNIQGQLVEQLPPHTATINVSNYTKGQYIVKVGETTLKFIKE